MRILKAVVPQGLPSTAKKVLQLVAEVNFDGMKDVLLCTPDLFEENKYDENDSDLQIIPCDEEKARNLEVQVKYMRESIYLVHRCFDYEHSNGVFMKLLPKEQYPLECGSVIQLGTQTQFILERFNTGIIAAPGNRAHMEDQFII